MYYIKPLRVNQNQLIHTMINVRGLQRNVKNVVKNYTEPQVKVREATSNDPWGPSSTLISEIADLTYNVVAFWEIMQMIWKRLNDHGKNWRHVYKALVLLEYLIKTGSEKVAQQCRENIFSIQTLKDFQYLEDNKDQGMSVREKSKALVALLKDDEKLKTERTRSLKAKERFAQSASLMNNSPDVEAYQVTTDDDDEYVSWGSDFDESCSDDGDEGLASRTNGNCDNANDDYDLNDDDDDEDEDEDNQLTGRCGSYSLTGQPNCHPTSHQLRNLNDNNIGRSENIINHHHHRGSATYDNTYEAISETPSTSSYGGSSENSSTCFYETPPERRRGSCPSDTDKSSSGIGGMNGSTRSNSGDDRSDLSSLHFDGYSLDEKKRNSHDHDSDLNHHHYRDSHNHHHNLNNNNNHHHLHRQLSVEVTTEYIMRELNRKKRTLLSGCEASSETSSGQCSEPSPKPRMRPSVKPVIPPKPNIAQYNQLKPGNPGTRRKIRRKVVRPTGEPPPPPVPKSPPPISPASSKLSLTDRLAELTLDDLNEVLLGVQLSSEPEDDGVADDVESGLSKSSKTTRTSYNNDNLNSPTTTNCLNQKDQKQLQSINNHNLTDSQNQNQEQLNDEMGLINTKISNKSSEQSDNKPYDNITDNNNHDNQSSSLGINEINDIVNGIMDHDDEDFGDYETPLNFTDPISQQINHLNNLRSNLPTSPIINKTPATTSANSGNSGHHQCKAAGSPTVSSTSGSPSGCNRSISRSSSVASGSFPPDLSFSHCTGISPYPISPPPPFDDNFCCSCRKLMKSVGSTPNLNAIRSSSSSSRSELSLSQVTSTTPLSSSLSSTSSMRNQSNQPSTTTPATLDNNSHNSSSPHHHHHHHHHHHVHHNQQHQQQNHQSHLHSTSNLSLLTVDRPKLPRSKPDCGNTNSNNSNNNKSFNNNNNLTSNNNNNNNTSTGISLKAEIAAKFAEKAAYAKKIINSRPPFKPFESIYATGKSFGFSSSSSSNHHAKSSISASSLNINANHNNHNINRSGSTSSLAQRPLPPLPDDVMPIEKYSWFHGLERDSASTVLKNLGTDGSYLVRPSKRAGQSNPLTLSILNHGKVFHLNIRRRSDGLYCLGKEKDKERTFASVPALIRFHQKEPILLTTKGESAGITKLMVTPISSSSTINPSSSSQLTATS